MKVTINSVIVRSLALLLAASVAFTQERVAFAQEQAAFRQEELDQMLAPIALYPDSLLSQILMASTYPLEVVQAARWSRARPGLKGLDAVKAAEPMDWDPSVKSLVAFPQILSVMDEKIDWTQRLGEAFLAQQPQVMDTVQRLRAKAAEAGNLGASERVRVTREGENILIEPAAPDVIYVPYYNPTVVYGPWWWPAYPPVYWGPPPGYYYAGPGYPPAFIWGSGFVISAGFFFGHTDWRRRQVTVIQNNVIVNRQTTVIRRNQVAVNDKPAVWRHNPAHRRGVPYQNASLQKEFGRPGASSNGARRDFARQDPSAAVRPGNGDRPSSLRDGRTGERGKAALIPDSRAPRPDRPAAQGNTRHTDPRTDTARPQARSTAPQSTITPPAARPDGRPPQAASGNRVPQPSAKGEAGRRAEGAGDRRQDNGGQGTVPRREPPAARPPAAGANSAPQAGNGNRRGNGEAKSGGGRRQSAEREGGREK